VFFFSFYPTFFAFLTIVSILSYPGNYTKSRQLFQDKIITKLLDDAIVQDSKNGMSCRTPTEPWIVFTAGVMGAGKSHTMKRLASQGYFPLKSFVIVDPDDIRQQFPEFHLYASRSKEKAGERTHKEAGYVTEITTSVALNRGYNVLVDGSLRDWEWYIAYFKMLKREYKHLRVAILYISAPREKIFERAKVSQVSLLLHIEVVFDLYLTMPSHYPSCKETCGKNWPRRAHKNTGSLTGASSNIYRKAFTHCRLLLRT
jgi:predicted kinase